MNMEFLAYGITLGIGLIAGYFTSSYRKFKDLVSLFDKAIEDDRITSSEITEIIKVLRR